MSDPAVRYVDPLNRPEPSAAWITVDPKLAEQWLGRNDSNRNQRPSVIARYTRDMRNGRWGQSGDSVKFDWNGRLIDGQHRLRAIIDSGVTARTLVVKGLDPEVQDVLDVTAKRSAADALKFNGVEHERDMCAATARIAMASEGGLLRTALSAAKADLTNAEIVAWVLEHPDVQGAARLSRESYRDIGCTPSVLAYVVWRLRHVDALKADEFVRSMAEFRTSGDSDPRRTVLTTIRRAHDERRRLEDAAQVYMLFKAWNAWRDGKPMKGIRLTIKTNTGTEGAPIPIPR